MGVYILMNLAGIGLAAYKCSMMGLIPSTQADWLEFLHQAEVRILSDPPSARDTLRWCGTLDSRIQTPLVSCGHTLPAFGRLLSWASNLVVPNAPNLNRWWFTPQSPPSPLSIIYRLLPPYLLAFVSLAAGRVLYGRHGLAGRA